MAGPRFDSSHCRRLGPILAGLVVALALPGCRQTPPYLAGTLPRDPDSSPLAPRPAEPTVLSQSPSTPASRVEDAQTPVTRVIVQGNTRTPTAEILRYIRTRDGEPYDAALIWDDVLRLNKTGKFGNVKTHYQDDRHGRIVIFEVDERPIIDEVKFVGCQNISKKKLAQEIKLKKGDPFDRFAIDEGRRVLEDFYRDKGFPEARVSVFERGLEDQRVIYVINEGPKSRFLWTKFEGNTVASDAKLRTKIQSKPGIFWYLNGEVKQEQIEQDRQKLIDYYRALGYFRARVGSPILDYGESRNWAILTFVIDEGPRYEVRKISLIGNQRIASDELAAEFKLKEGQFFRQADMQGDVASIKDKYGAIGYIFADVDPEIRFPKESGQLDLVYHVQEGRRCRAGLIDVEIRGEFPHTRETTVLDRLSVYPGEIIDIRDLRASERRLRFSQLFQYDPATGVAPQIVVSPPELNDETEVARQPESPPFRGQSPDPSAPASPGPTHSPAPQAGPAPDRSSGLMPGSPAENPLEHMPRFDRSGPDSLLVRGQNADQRDLGRHLRWQSPSQAASPSSRLDAASQALARETSNEPTAEERLRLGARPTVIRGQYSPEAGRTVPTLRQPEPAVSTWPRPGDYRLPPAAPSTAPATSPSSAATAPVLSSPATSDEVLTEPSPAPGAPPVAPAPAYGAPYRAIPSGAVPGSLPAQGGVVDIPPPFLTDPLDDEPPVFVPLNPRVTETQTGRMMFSVGVNSDAGLLGSVVIDEQNFDWTRLPRGWEDIRNGTAWRGAGQRFRAEAVPGTQVHRYSVTFQEPYLRGSNVSLSLNGFFHSRRYTEYDEERLGGRVALGYQFPYRPDLSVSLAFRGAQVNIFDPITPTPTELAEVLGDNALYGFRLGLTHDTRDHAYLPTEGYLFEIGVEHVLGSFEYTRGDLELRKYFMLRQHPDGSGRHVLSVGGRAAVTSSDTPIYEHYYAGGFSTLRGFDYRGASPRDPITGVMVGGEFMLLASVEYMFPLTADDNVRAVAFCDTGTVEPTIHNWRDRYRVAPGFGLRISIPAMGSAPIALDFAFPISSETTDDKEVFSFWVGWMR